MIKALSLWVVVQLVSLISGQTTTTIRTTTITFPTVSLNCDFEKDFCAWTNFNDRDTYLWRRNNGPTLSDLSGPLTDHTTQSLNGTYAYIDTNENQLPNATARIKSPPITVRAAGFCFSFWYHMFGQSINTFNINLQRIDDPTNITTIWTRQTSQGNTWRYGQVSLTELGNFVIIIEAKAGGSASGDIAIDDLVSKTSACSNSQYCDFESDTCGFTNSPLARFNWTRSRGGSSSSTSGPSYDHTTLSKLGYYMFMDTRYRSGDDNAILISPGYKLIGNGLRCIELWYHAYGYDIRYFNIYKLEKEGVQGRYELLFSTYGSQGNEWHIVQLNVPIVSSREFFIVIEGIVDDPWDWYSWVTYADIAIDDFVIKDTACQPMGDCDFEQDTCAWKNAEKDTDFEWVRHKGVTPSEVSGPSVDHTFGTSVGTYLFIDSSQIKKANAKAQLISPVFERFASRCFQFYYHMNVKNSTLNLYRKTYKSTLAPTKLWSTTVNTGDNWVLGQLSIPNNLTSNYVLIMEGVFGGQNSGDIALDDFKVINDELCPTPDDLCAYKCSNGNCLPIQKVCNFIADCAGGEDEAKCGYSNVTFESDTSNWNDSSSASSLSKWIRGRNGDDGNKGPSVDHTTLTTSGYFLYLDRNNASSGGASQFAQFKSPVMRNAYTTCQIRFWYQINGRGIGRLEAYVNVGSQKSLLIKLEDATNNQWRQAVIYLGTYKKEFFITLEANRSYSTIGHIAVDDINFSSCAPQIRNVSCTFNEYKCANSLCVATTRLCDLTDDCGDLTDETNVNCTRYPRKCDFENGLCEWSPDETNTYNWIRNRAIESTSNVAPQRDHTTNVGTGNYIYVDTKGKPAGSRSIIYGPKMSSTSSSCRVRFYYYAAGRSIAKVAVYIRYQIGGSLYSKWSKTAPFVDSWDRTDIYLGPTTFTSNVFQVAIEATVSNFTNQDGIVVVDDITFTPECYSTNEIMPVVFTTTFTPTCGVNGFRCSNGKCLNKTQLCDFVRDCPNGEDEANCGICEFENSTCGWYDNSYGDHIWNLTTALNAEIPQDVTTGTNKGSLMNYETADGAFNGLTRLYSPVFGQTSSSCEFEFYYYKINPTPKSTSLSLFLEYDDLSKERLWKVDDNSVNNDWTRTRISLHSRRAGAKLYFEATHLDQIDLAMKPLLAIDKTNFINCQTIFNTSCTQANVFQCGNNNCIPDNYVCDFSNDCLNGNDEKSCTNYTRCNFDNNLDPLCDWTSDDDSDLYWKRAKAEQFLNIDSNYPTFDHTTLSSSGYFYYNDNSGGVAKVSRLASPIFYPTFDSKCSFRMWFYMTDYNDIQQPLLKIYMRQVLGGPMILVAEKSNIQSSDWILLDAQLNSNTNFQIVVETISKNAQLAIDDFSFTPSCKVNKVDKLPTYIFTTPAPDPTCGQSNQFRCKNSKECINMNDLCNFRFDCNDRSDEESCPAMCTFEDNTLCNWSNDVKPGQQPKITWKATKASNFDNSLRTDHTLNTAEGSFIYLDPADKEPADLARTLSPVYNQAGQTCSFEFWYQILGDSPGKINVYLRNQLTESLIASISNGVVSKWTYFNYQLPTCLSQFQFVIEGVRGSSNDSFIAIDDVKLADCEYPKPVEQQQCSSDQYTCKSKHCVPAESLCDMNNDCCDGSDEVDQSCSLYLKCNFEENDCGFVDISQSQAKRYWNRTRPDANLLDLNKPLLDHTRRSAQGHYLQLVQNDKSTRGQIIPIEIPFKSSSNGCAIKLWYWMSNSYYANLKISTRKSIGELWNDLAITSTSTNSWTKLEAEIPVGVDFQLIIAGELEPNENGFLAIDDVSFTPSCDVDLELILPTFVYNSTDSPDVSRTTSKKVDDKKSNSPLSITVIIVIVVVALVVVAGAVVGTIFFIRHRRRNAGAQRLENEGQQAMFNNNFNS